MTAPSPFGPVRAGLVTPQPPTLRDLLDIDDPEQLRITLGRYINTAGPGVADAPPEALRDLATTTAGPCARPGCRELIHAWSPTFGPLNDYHSDTCHRDDNRTLRRHAATTTDRALTACERTP